MKKKIFALFGVLLILSLLSACGGAGTLKTSPEENGTSFVSLSLSGGSGKASVESPSEVRNRSGTLLATVRWNSPYYDYMVVEGETYYPVNRDGNSVFEIPVPSLTCTLQVQADTTAMSMPHLIDYTLSFGAEETAEKVGTASSKTASVDPLPGQEPTGRWELSYAKQFEIETYDGGLSLITIGGTDQYLLVPVNGEEPENLSPKVTVLRQSLENIYLVSSSAMDMFRACNAMDSLAFCGLNKEDWHIETARRAMEEGTLIYAGKYSAPDYEMLRNGNCSLAIENKMITHSPEVMENLEALGIPVLVETSSYEETPQGRMEWIRLYGLLTGHEKEAEESFAAQIAAFDALKDMEPSDKTAALFYVTTNGTVSIRNSSDYLPQMITLAGGKYIFSDVGVDSDDATTNIQMEEFYARAKDADFLLYNSTIPGELSSLDDFLSLNPLLANMKAVKEGNVYCISENLYQSSMELGNFAQELARLFRGDTENLTYITKLN